MSAGRTHQAENPEIGVAGPVGDLKPVPAFALAVLPG